MKTIVEITKIGLTKLNNSEYLNICTRTSSLINAVGPDTLGIEAEVVEQFDADLTLLGDLVAKSYAYAETADLAEIDKQRDALVEYLLDNVRNAQDIPIKSKADAAKELWTKVLKPYEKVCTVPKQQKTMMLNGMLYDLAKPENTAKIETLGLNDAVEELIVLNTNYMVLTEQRTASKATTKTDDSATLRKELDTLYYYMTTVAFCESVAKPTETTATFVKNVNAIIEEINALYNLRIASSKKKEDEPTEPSEPSEPETEVPATPTA